MIHELIKQGEGEFSWLDKTTGVSYDSKKDFLQTSILGFCGCGYPDSAMEYILEMLKKVEDKFPFEDEDMPSLFFLYWADSNEFIDHGTSITNSFLTTKGEELISDIKWCLENENDA